MPAPFATTRRVEFGDTDMAGIMHFANFFRFMEVAETDFLRGRGLSVAFRRSGEKVGFPRVAAACDYKSPARFGDVLTIAVTVEKVGRRSVTYRYDFSRDGTEVAVGRMTAVYCHETADGMASADLPAEVRAALADGGES